MRVARKPSGPKIAKAVCESEIAKQRPLEALEMRAQQMGLMRIRIGQSDTHTHKKERAQFITPAAGQLGGRTESSG